VEGLVVSIYGESAHPDVRWTVGQSEVFEAVLLAYFYQLTQGPADEGLIEQLKIALADSLFDLENNLSWTVEDLIARLEAV
jgi:hypothetical protein